MNSFKRLALILVTVCTVMLCTVLCAANVSAAQETASGKCGDSLYWTLYDNGDLFITGTGTMTKWAAPEYAPWYQYRNSVTNLIIGSGVKNIGRYAFHRFQGLTIVKIPDNVETIDKSAFYSCENLTTVIIGNGVTTIGESAFSRCTSLSRVTIGDSVTSIGVHAFSLNPSLISIDIPEGVMSIEDYAFSSCENLSRVIVPSTAGYLNRYSFAYNTNLTEFIVLADRVGYDTNALTGSTSKKLIMYGYEGSTTETYAFRNNRRFAEIDEKYVNSLYRPKVDWSSISLENGSVIEGSTMDLRVTDGAGKPISGAKVTLGTAVAYTDANGCVLMRKPSSSAATLKISAANYVSLTFNNYTLPEGKSFDLFVLTPSGDNTVIPLTCNGTNITAGFAQINNKADLFAEIVVCGNASSGIKRYELVQNYTVIAESTNGQFKVYNDKFTRNASLYVRMYTNDGSIVTKSLNIRIVSFTLTLAPITLSDGKIRIPDDVEFLGGIELELEALKDFPDYAVTNTDIKIAYNQSVVDKDLSKLNAGLRKWMEEHNRKTPYSKFTFDVGGYVMVTVNHTGVEKVTGELVFAAKYSNGFNKTVILWGVPVNVSVEFGLGGELSIKEFGYDFSQARIIMPSLDGTVSGDITAKAGVGVEWLSAGIYGTLKMKLALDILPDFMVDQLTAEGELGLYAKVILLGEKKLPLLTTDGEIVIYDKNAANTVYSLCALADVIYDESGYTVSERTYLADRTEWNTTSNGSLQGSAYDNANPKIVSSDDVTLMVYVDDNGSADCYNYQQLVYSVYTAAGWSKPAPVDTNSLNDAEFDVYTDGEDIWVVYTEANRSITAEDGFEDYASILEVNAARFDPESGTFTEHTVLTNNSVMERLPSVTSANGIPTAVWVENGDNNLFGMGENNTLYISTYENGAWTAPSVLCAKIPAAVDLDAGVLEGELAVAVISDADSDFITGDDSILTVYSPTGAGISYGTDTYGSVYFEDDILYWYRAGEIYSTSSIGGDSTLVSDAYLTDSGSDFCVITNNGEKYILYRVYSTESGSDLYLIRQIGDGWSLPVRVTETVGYIDSFAAFIMNGNIYTVYRRTDASISEDGMTTVSELRAETYEPAVKLEIVDISVDSDDLFDDNTVTLLVSVKNSGAESANGFTVYAGYTAAGEYTDVIHAGETAIARVSYILSEGTTEIDVRVTDELGMSEYGTARIGYTDFRVFLEGKTVAGKPYINASVVNAGNISGKGTLYLKNGDKDGATVYSESLTLAFGEQKTVFAAIVDETIDIVYAEFLPDEADYFEEDNYTSAEVVRMSSFSSVEGTCGENISWTIENGTMTLDGQGEIPDFAAGKAPWYAQRNDITKVVIGKDITHIGDFAFYYCTNLAEVVFEAGSKLETIGNGAFGYISALKSIIIPASVAEIKANAFYFCTGLETMDFEANSKLQTIGNYALRQCKALKTAYIPETVTTIGGALLSGAKQATLLVAEASPAHDYAVQNGYLYELRTGERCGYCGENLKWVIKDGVLTVSGYGEMAEFEATGANAAPWRHKRGEITKIVIGKNVTTIGKSAFYYMRNLTEVEFTEGSTLKTIGDYAFNYTASLREITIPASVTKLWHYAFNNSADLTAVKFEDGSRLADIGGFVFNGCAKLETVYIPFTVSYIDNARMFTAGAATVLQVAEGSVAHDFALSKGYNVELREESMSGTFGEGLTWTLEANGTLTIDGEGAMPEFSYAATGSKAAPWAGLRLLVKKVVIGNGITNIGDFSFFYMNNLEAIEFEENSTLERIGIGVFGYSKKLKNIVLPASLKVIDNYAFYISPNMETVSFEEGSRLETIGNLIFRECSGLKSFYIPESVKSIGGAILSLAKQATLKVAGLSEGYRHALEYGYKMELRDNVYGGTFGVDGTLTWNLNLEDAVLYIGGSGAMNDMSNVTTSADAAPWMIARPYITKVVIGKDVENIGAYAFYFMTKLAEVEFEAASKVASIGTGAFGYSKLLKTITLPASVVEIKANAFAVSAGLETVTFEEGSRLTTMGNYVFMNCTALKSVFIPDGVTAIGASILNGAKQATVQVANGSYAHTYAVSKGYKVEVRG